MSLLENIHGDEGCCWICVIILLIAGAFFLLPIISPMLGGIFG